jgi:hypothetical protein
MVERMDYAHGANIGEVNKNVHPIVNGITSGKESIFQSVRIYFLL